MIRIPKYYPHRYNVRVIYAYVGWKTRFLEVISRTFGINGSFTLKEIIALFDSFTEPSIRNKFLRLYRQGFFKRELHPFQVRSGRRNIFVYEFTDSWKKYRNSWGSFDYVGPLVEAKKPEIVEKKTEITKTIISRDKYLGEI